MAEFAPWAEVDLAAIAANVSVIKRHLGPDVALMAVVKGNAYGHGAAAVAATCLEQGVAMLGVARLDEAVELRQAGIRAPILILNPTAPADAATLQEHDLAAVVPNLALARELAARLPQGPPLTVHFKVDTGMGRVGSLAQPGADGCPDPQRIARVVGDVVTVGTLPQLRLEGLCTHLTCGGSDDAAPTRLQCQILQAILQELERAGVAPRWRHLAASGATFLHPFSQMNLVRPGIALYGYNVPGGTDGLTPAMTLKTRIMELRHLMPGDSVSYDMTHRVTTPATVATVALGYGDGYDRRFSNCGKMLVRGVAAPILGRVCMDMTMLDVTHIPQAAVGDEVVAFGRQGEALLPADAIAATIGTISYEIVTGLTRRVPRKYILPACAR